FFSSRRRHTRSKRDWSSDVCSSDLFQHPVAGTYKKERVLAGKPYFSVASGGGTGRTLHPDNMAAGPASYGMTDTMGRMHSDAQRSEERRVGKERRDERRQGRREVKQ